MNISLFIRPKAYLVLTTLYFTGSVISSGALYLLSSFLAEENMWRLYLLVVGTFIMGMASVYLTSQSKKQTVVYLEKQKGNVATKQTENSGTYSVININRVDNIIEGKNDILQNVILELCKQMNAGAGALYTAANNALELKHGYALAYDRYSKEAFSFGEGLVGRVAVEGNTIYLDKLPEGYITIFSGLGAATPSVLVIVPIKRNTEVVGIIEIAAFKQLNKNTIADLERVGNKLAEVIA
ncbi:MAG TPA: GAF domain-containing protein [Cyclobacteriaceae bacterium]|nr:GAF domain-containing protein [Cyclobacteriaceae bacterium]